VLGEPCGEDVQPVERRCDERVTRAELTPEDMRRIDALDRGQAGRTRPHPDGLAFIPA
jgi:hypothetical protein